MVNGRYKIFAVNPGSTSTKIAMFEDDKPIFITTIEHKPEELKGVQEQLAYRKNCILNELKKHNVTLDDTDVFVGRGGSMYPCVGGIYEVNDKMLEHARFGPFGEHPARLSSQLCKEFLDRYGGKACVVDPPDTDELMEVARITGIKGVYHESRSHALNQKAVGRYYAEKNSVKYQDLNLVIAHIGGGISITAHEKGQMIDTNDILHGGGPIAPTRCGDITPGQMIELCFSNLYSRKELENMTHKNGGLLSLLGESDIRVVEKRIEGGDKFAKLALDSMIYSIAKCIGERAVALKGKVDQILLTGGVSHNNYVVNKLRDYVEWISDITVIAGEFEMEALGAGALRWVKGEESSKVYAGIPRWQGKE